MRRQLAIVAIAGLALAGCEDFPKDAQDSLERVRAGEPLRVGWTPAEPWLSADEKPSGIEADLIRSWAQELSANIEWTAGSEHQLIRALEQNALDVVVAGFTTDGPWGSRIGQSRPYLETEIVVGISHGTTSPPSWRGLGIRYDRKRPHFAGLIRAIGAEPVPDEEGSLAPVGAVYAQELEAEGFIASGKSLGREAHVLATAPSENALTLALDRFLHVRKDWVEERLAERAP